MTMTCVHRGGSVASPATAGGSPSAAIADSCVGNRGCRASVRNEQNPKADQVARISTIYKMGVLSAPFTRRDARDADRVPSALHRRHGKHRTRRTSNPSAVDRCREPRSRAASRRFKKTDSTLIQLCAHTLTDLHPSPTERAERKRGRRARRCDQRTARQGAGDVRQEAQGCR